MTVAEAMDELKQIESIFEKDLDNELGINDIPMLIDLLIKYKQELLHKKVV